MRQQTVLAILLGAVFLVFVVQRLPQSPRSPPSKPLINAPTPSRTPTIAESDRISLSAFKRLAHLYHAFDAHETNETRAQPLSASSVPVHPPGNPSIIFSSAWELPAFLDDVLPRIRFPFVLVTADSSMTMPKDAISLDRAREFVADKRLLAWYTTNCDALLDKMHCLPLGINSYIDSPRYLQQLYEDGVGLVEGMRQAPEKVGGKNTLLVSFNTQTNHVLRIPLMEMFCGEEGADMSMGLRHLRNNYVSCFLNQSMPQDQFYREKLAAARFVLAPHGNGLDTYRVWETLLLGSYPIVKASSLDAMYEGLPVLILEDYSLLNADMLEMSYLRFQSTRQKYEKLYIQYWEAAFNSHIIP
ncbi:hypothetical protein BC830DRAFT_1167878 [Chytriomyces sp. MP71]|nr:hypothetical protein BC830DRAFT_1167878 [Chytriomyces sp. MP71]